MTIGETENMTAKAEEVNMLLAEIWGKDSLLSKVADPIDPQTALKQIEEEGAQKIAGKTILYTLDENERILGSIALKMTSPHTLEIGSIALHEQCRGKGMSGKLYELIKADLIRLVNEFGMQVTSYATIGSPVMTHIIDRIEDCLEGQSAIYPTNIAPFIIPVNQRFIPQPFALTTDTISFTSTTELLSIPTIPKAETELISPSKIIPELSQLFKLYPEQLPGKQVTEGGNIYIPLPINMDLLIVSDPETNVDKIFSEVKEGRACQIRVPVSERYRNLIAELLNSRYMVSGITVSDNRAYLCFFTEINPQTFDMLYSLAYMEIQRVPSLANALISINTRRGIFKPRSFSEPDSSVFQVQNSEITAS